MRGKQILIESKWNLKDRADTVSDERICILIESKWNLKIIEKVNIPGRGDILIESKWNLKFCFILVCIESS